MKKLPPRPRKPEPRSKTIAVKVRESTDRALQAAAKDNNGRSKSELCNDVLEGWLKDAGYLK